MRIILRITSILTLRMSSGVPGLRVSRRLAHPVGGSPPAAAGTPATGHGGTNCCCSGDVTRRSRHAGRGSGATPTAAIGVVGRLGGGRGGRVGGNRGGRVTRGWGGSAQVCLTLTVLPEVHLVGSARGAGAKELLLAFVQVCK